MRTLILVMAFLLFPNPAVAEDTAQLETKAKNLAFQLGTRLKAQLKTAIEAGGPANAITTCNVIAPQIAEELSTQGWKVGRTSLKLRNPNNSPDEWERSTLLAFEKQMAAGVPAGKLQNSTLESSQGVTRYRFMKAIPVGGVCLACHGEDLSKDVQSTLAEKYPLDEATGYRLGELRGAFTLSKTLETDHKH